MLTLRERLLSTAVAAVFVAAAASTSYVSADLSARDAATQVALEPAPAPPPPPAAAPVEAPVEAPPPAAPPPPPPPPPPAPEPALAGPLPAPPAPPDAGCPVRRAPNAKPYVPKPLPAPAVADSALPAPLAAGPKAADLSAIAGKGIWVTNWPKTDVDVPRLVARAKAAGLTNVWVRTGGSRQGWYGDRVLPELVPAAHAAGLKVVAWDFPFLSDPVADAERAKRALDLGIDAIAPDVETTAEGTHASPRRVELYLSLVRSYAGDRPVAATVPRPTPQRIATFPYASFAPYADVFVPMVYWSCKEPGALVAESLSFLGRWLPVAPVGQAYDMGSEGGRVGVPTQAETWRFLDAAKRGGAVGASLWTIEQVGPGQWTALSGYPWDASR